MTEEETPDKSSPSGATNCITCGRSQSRFDIFGYITEGLHWQCLECGLEKKKVNKNIPDSEHISFFMPKSIMNEIRLLVKKHEEQTGFKLTVSACIRKLVADGIKVNKINESQKTRETSRQLNP